jgi:acetyl-CoA carboxylase biotin carboxyl carrier protein
MDREGILRLIRMLKASRATELEVRQGASRVRLVRPSAPAAAAAQPAAPPTHAEALALHGVLVPSGHVGLFRRRREPGAGPLVEVGQKVTRGQPLGVVESLRRPVVIESPVDGEVLGILAEDGERVEYGTPLFRLLPASPE